MLAFPKLLAAFGTMFLLMSGVVYPLPEVQPHEMMPYIMDARLLWEKVVNNIFPGVRHTPNIEHGVSERWIDFLREHGNDALEDAIRDMRRLTETFDNRHYSGAIKKFRNFLKPEDKRAMLIVTKPGEQYLARRMVNAFTDFWYQHYAAEREMEQEALEREEAALARRREGSSDLGPGEVLEAEQGTSKRRRPLRMDSPPREGTDESW